MIIGNPIHGLARGVTCRNNEEGLTMRKVAPIMTAFIFTSRSIGTAGGGGGGGGGREGERGREGGGGREGKEGGDIWGEGGRGSIYICIMYIQHCGM